MSERCWWRLYNGFCGVLSNGMYKDFGYLYWYGGCNDSLGSPWLYLGKRNHFLFPNGGPPAPGWRHVGKGKGKGKGRSGM